MNKQSKLTKRDQYTIVLEDLRSKFEVFGEGLSQINGKLDEHDQRFDRLELKTDIGFLNLEQRMGNVELRMGNIEQRMGSLESNLTEFKEDPKIGLEKFQNHENRITALEKVVHLKE